MSLEHKVKAAETKASMEAKRKRSLEKIKLAPLVAKMEGNFNNAISSGLESLYHSLGMSVGTVLSSFGKTVEIFWANKISKSYITKNAGKKYEYLEEVKKSAKDTFSKHGSKMIKNITISGSELLKGFGRVCLYTLRKTSGI